MFKKAKNLFEEFCKTINQLRDPATGCPWDLKQDHQSLRRYMLEEAYEAVEAMADANPDKICEELGDVLLQVVLNAQIAADQKNFAIEDVIRCVNQKMIRRHPHVFQDRNLASDTDNLRKRWNEIKAKEKKNDESFFKKAKSHFPATTQAYEIGKQTSKIGFDWDLTEKVFEKFQSEVSELLTELVESEFQSSPTVMDEIGDVYFTLAQLCRHLGLDPETMAHQGNLKFLSRFKKVEMALKKKGSSVLESSQGELEKLWENAKK